MASTRVYSRSFAGGELSPEMFGRLDDAKFQSGAATVRNCVVTPTGAVKNRAGFAYVNATKNNGVARLIRFTFSLNQTMVIELGAGYFRFYTQGKVLLQSNRWFLLSAPCAISIASPGVITLLGHEFQDGDTVVFTTTGTLPTGLVSGTVYYVVDSSQPEGQFSVAATSGGSAIALSGSQSGQPTVYGYYNIGDTVLLSGGAAFALYVCLVAEYDIVLSNATYWQPESPLGQTPYEVANPYSASDLFGIHYVQSADVMTLVHPNYPPAQLSRQGASQWSYAPIEFGPPLATPTGVAVAASPGYQAQISTITDGTGAEAGNALITTVANHTLALGDGVYVANLTFTPSVGAPQVLDGFYMVQDVPADMSGNLINDELYLMDYSGNNIAFQSAGTYSSGATIQFGTKIFNIVNPYAVQAFAPDGVSSSLLSASVSVLNNLDVPGSYNTISWGAVSGALNYNVYKQFNGLWGFIGTTPALSFADNNIAPDMSITPGTPYGVFSGPGNYPSAVSYFQQRKCFAGTLNAPQNVWMSNSGTESMFDYSIPSLATDAVVFRVAAQQADIIQHIVPMLQLILLTSESEFALTPPGTSAVTPSSIDVNPESYIGASGVQPTVVNVSMVYAAARGGHVYSLSYAWTVNGYLPADISLRAAHLFDGLTIVDQAYSKAPWPIIWFVSSGGDLLGMTYIPEEQLVAWHHHDTQGTFQSCVCVSEGSEDVLYAVISRTVNGQAVNYIERQASRQFGDLADAFFVDAGATLDGTNLTVTTVTISGGTTWTSADTLTITATASIFSNLTIHDGSILVVTDPNGVSCRITITAFHGFGTTATGYTDTPIPVDLRNTPTTEWAQAVTQISGLTWLEGCVVSVLADGGVQSQKTVTGGAITLDHAAIVVTVGLPYASDLQTLPAVMQLDGYGQGRTKNINKAWVKVFQSGALMVGPDANHLTETPVRTTEPWGTPPALQSAELLVMNTPSWQQSGQVLIRQANPMPMEVVGLTLEVAIGG